MAYYQVIMPVALAYNPQLVIVSSGFDAALNDPLVRPEGQKGGGGKKRKKRGQKGKKEKKGRRAKKIENSPVVDFRVRLTEKRKRKNRCLLQMGANWLTVKFLSCHPVSSP